MEQKKFCEKKSLDRIQARRKTSLAGGATNFTNLWILKMTRLFLNLVNPFAPESDHSHTQRQRQRNNRYISRYYIKPTTKVNIWKIKHFMEICQKNLLETTHITEQKIAFGRKLLKKIKLTLNKLQTLLEWNFQL